MTRAVFTAVARLAPGTEKWESYIAWSGFTHLREVVTLDSLLCPGFFDELVPEDWDHNIHEDFRTELFLDADHVIRRTAGADVDVLALVEEPTPDDVAHFAEPGFVFCGFELVDFVAGGISALLNCGGFENVFMPADLSAATGLVADLGRAREIQQRLRSAYPEDPHADCTLWAIWRLASAEEREG